MNQKKNQDILDQDLLLAEPTLWKRWFGWTAVSPVEIIGQSMDLWVRWKKSRKWKYSLLMLPILLVCFGFSAIVCLGSFVDSRTKAAWYVEQAEKEVKFASEETSKTETIEMPENTSDNQDLKADEKEKSIRRADFIDLMFRRVLQLEKGNKQALYYVAIQTSRFGKQAAARQIMESLAPVRFGGFDLAHAWLATDMIQRNQKGQQINLDQLKHHLKHCTNREDINPLLLVVYAQLLQKDDQISQAEQILKRAAKFDPSVLLGSIAIYNRKGLVGQARAAADLIQESLKDNLVGEKGETNLIVISQGLVQTNRLDQAIELLKSGVSKQPNSNKLKRALSDAYRLKFRATASQKEGQVSVNLDLLNLAIVIDPTNIAVQEELSLLSISTAGKNSAILDSLRTQIAVSGTSFSARLLLAEYHFRNQEFDSAVKQYEVVLAELSNMTLAINNLAMIYTLVPEPKLDEALKMIDRAVAIAPDYPEFQDSRGDILVSLGKKPEAAECYEKALVKGPERLTTREKLIAILDELDEKKATEQRELLARVKQILEDQRLKVEAAQKQKLDSPPESNSLKETSNPPDVLEKTPE